VPSLVARLQRLLLRHCVLLLLLQRECPGLLLHGLCMV
jgi:hypothetical protein